MFSTPVQKIRMGNDNLLRGPRLLNNLTGIHIRSRTLSTIITADVEKAFHQIELKPRDRDATRFLWMKNLRKEVSDENIQTY